MPTAPDFVILPSQTFAGLETRVICSRGDDANYHRQIPILWNKFFALVHTIPTIEPMVVYGLYLSPQERNTAPNHPDERAYLASVRIKTGGAALNKVVWNTTPGTYARFQHIGPVTRIHETMKYIEDIGLPTCGRRPAKGAIIERYDKRFDPGSQTSLMEIFVPVE